MLLEITEYLSNTLLDIFHMDLEYFETSVPVTRDIMHIILAFGWALLIGNLVFQATRSMAAGLGFEGEDPRTLFTRTFVFSFLLISSRPICGIGLGITKTVIHLLSMPDSVHIPTPDESAFGLDASWLLAVIVGLVLIFQIGKLFLEIGERYVITAVLAILSPLAFGMGGSKSTEDIFRGWCRMFGSMCLMMTMNVVFLKLLLSAMAAAPAGAAVLPWMVLVIAIVKSARKIDDIIGRVGLNPARTGAPMNWGAPGMMAMMVARNIGGSVVGAFTNQASHTKAASASSSSHSSSETAKGAAPGKPYSSTGPAEPAGSQQTTNSAGANPLGKQDGSNTKETNNPSFSSATSQSGGSVSNAQRPTRPPIHRGRKNGQPAGMDVRMDVDPARAADIDQGLKQNMPASSQSASSQTDGKPSAAAPGASQTAKAASSTENHEAARRQPSVGASGRRPKAPMPDASYAASGQHQQAAAPGVHPVTAGHPNSQGKQETSQPGQSGKNTRETRQTVQTGNTSPPNRQQAAGPPLHPADRPASQGQSSARPHSFSPPVSQPVPEARQETGNIVPPVPGQSAGETVGAGQPGTQPGRPVSAPAYTKQSPPNRSVTPGSQGTAHISGSIRQHESTPQAACQTAADSSGNGAAVHTGGATHSAIHTTGSVSYSTGLEHRPTNAGGGFAPSAVPLAPSARPSGVSGGPAAGASPAQPSGSAAYTSLYSESRGQEGKAQGRTPEAAQARAPQPGRGRGVQDNQHAHIPTRPPSGIPSMQRPAEPAQAGQSAQIGRTKKLAAPSGRTHHASAEATPRPDNRPPSEAAGQVPPAHGSSRKKAKKAGRGAAHKSPGGGHEPAK